LSLRFLEGQGGAFDFANEPRPKDLTTDDRRPTIDDAFPYPTAKYGKFRFVCSADPNP